MIRIVDKTSNEFFCVGFRFETKPYCKKKCLRKLVSNSLSSSEFWIIYLKNYIQGCLAIPDDANSDSLGNSDDFLEENLIFSSYFLLFLHILTI